MQSNSMTDIIYDYFTSRILFGYYLPGDRLPSIRYVRQQFQVSAQTIRSAFAKMREHGYIETIERKHSIVIYHPDEHQIQQYQYSFLSRREGMIDICRSFKILFGPIALHYFQMQNKDSINQIRSQLKKLHGHSSKQLMLFYLKAMQPLNNPLALNLSWEVIRYLRIPYLPRVADFDDTDPQSSTHIERMLSFVENGDAAGAVNEMMTFTNNVTLGFFENIPFAADAYDQVEPVPFKWHIYWERPQLCYTLAAEMMKNINEQVYKPNEFLPSCHALAKEYGVSLITMRRTLELLGDMCMTETFNGIGTRVVSFENAGYPDFSHVQIRNSLILFLQALQICALTAKNVSVHTLSSLSSEDLQALSQKIEHLIEDRITFLLSGTCLKFIGEKSPSPFIREVYRQLYQILLWGHALYMVYQRTRVSNVYVATALELKKLLQNQDIQGFAAKLTEILEINVRVSKNMLLELGFPEDQLI